MKLPLIALISLILLPITIAEEKPKMMVSTDGFPAGNDSPEAAACDLARAFIKVDSKQFKETCIAPFGGGKSRETYESFLKKVTSNMRTESKKETRSPGGPKKLTKLFAARHLSLNGPASTGYAMHDFHDIMFVDVGVELVSGKTAINRTLVIKKKDGKWYVHPAPNTAKLLSVGLNNEEPSTIDFKEAYTIEKSEIKKKN